MGSGALSSDTVIENRQDRPIAGVRGSEHRPRHRLPHMATTSQHYALKTSHGEIALEESGTGGIAVVMIHGNSSCKEVFRHQLDSSLAEQYRLIAFDLPGHGRSGNAPYPPRSYPLTGYADLVVELVALLGLSHPVLIGWSLGGHIALEVAAKLPIVKGILITGTPPVANRRLADGFIPAPHLALAGRPDFTPEDVDMFGTAIFGPNPPAFLRDAIRRTHGEARRIVLEGAQAGVGIDQRWLVENLPVPLAVVNGANDPFLKLEYLDGLDYRMLWEGRCHRIACAGHASFWQQPEAFNDMAARFLDDIRTGAVVG